VRGGNRGNRSNNKPDVESRQQQGIGSIVGNPKDQILWIEQILKRISFDSKILSVSFVLTQLQKEN